MTPVQQHSKNLQHLRAWERQLIPVWATTPTQTLPSPQSPSQPDLWEQSSQLDFGSDCFFTQPKECYRAPTL